MSVYEFGPFQLDVERLLLLHGGAPVALGPKVVETMLALIEHPGDVLSKGALLDRIWPEGYVEEANLAQNIYVLRKTLRATWAVNAIETVPRRGYRFTASVRLVEGVAPAEPLVSVATAIPAPSGHHITRRIGAALATAALAVIALTGFSLRAISDRATHPALSDSGARMYQIGRYYWNLRTQKDVEKSIAYFEQVVDSDPHNAVGYAALAQASAVMGDYHYGALKPKVYFDRARGYASKALAIDSKSAEAHAAIGLIAMDEKHPDLAIEELASSIKLDPNYGPAREWYGIALLDRGDLQHARAELQLAGELDPLSVATTSWLGQVAYFDRRFDDAISYARQSLDLSPKRADGYATIGLAYEAMGDYARAIESFRKYGSLAADSHDPMEVRAESAAYLAHAYALARRPAEAQHELSYAIAHAKDVDPADLAIAMAASGKRSVALNVLRRVHSTMSWTAIANDPRFDALRGDAKFKQLAQGPA